MTLFAESRRFRRTVILLLCQPVLYVASFGPACWLADRQLLPHGLAESIYLPLAIACANGGCSEPLYWYGTLVESPLREPDIDRAGTIVCFGPLPTACEIRLLTLAWRH